jgi:hypothetical protein
LRSHAQLLRGVVGRLLVEHKHLRLVRAAGNVEGREGRGVAGEGLGHLLLGRVELHAAVDGAVLAGHDAAEQAPLAVRGHLVVGDLGGGEG